VRYFYTYLQPGLAISCSNENFSVECEGGFKSYQPKGVNTDSV